MKLAIHQPEFIPWMGFFYKMASADAYVIFDHVQFKKRYFENRNRIVSPRCKIDYLTVPVLNKDRFPQSINQVEIDNSKEWKRKLIKSIFHYYSKAPFFRNYFDELEKLIIENEYAKLLSLNLVIIDFFRQNLSIETPMICSSGLNVGEFKASDLILQICLNMNADEYLCGPSGRDYLNQDEFRNHNIQITWLDYECPPYQQLCDHFIPNLSTLDLLFNAGPYSAQIIMNQKKIREL